MPPENRRTSQTQADSPEEASSLGTSEPRDAENELQSEVLLGVGNSAEREEGTPTWLYRLRSYDLDPAAHSWPAVALDLEMLYGEIAACLRRREPLPEVLQDFLASVFEDVSAGVPPQRALRLVKRGGFRGYVYPEYTTRYFMALEVEGRIAGGATLTDAQRDVAERWARHVPRDPALRRSGAPGPGTDDMLRKVKAAWKAHASGRPHGWQRSCDSVGRSRVEALIPEWREKHYPHDIAAERAEKALRRAPQGLTLDELAGATGFEAATVSVVLREGLEFGTMERTADGRHRLLPLRR
jgi:hypothetical protein